MEADLVERARNRDVVAFQTLVEQHSPGLYQFLRGRLDNDQLLADVMQESFLRAWRTIPSFRGESSFRTWLYRIAYNLAITESKRTRRETPTLNEPNHADPLQSHLSERLEQEAEQRDVQGAIASLPQEDRELVTLLYRDRLTYIEISDLLGIPVGTVKVRLHRARVRMRDYLEKLWEVAR